MTLLYVIHRKNRLGHAKEKGRIFASFTRQNMKIKQMRKKTICVHTCGVWMVLDVFRRVLPVPENTTTRSAAMFLTLRIERRFHRMKARLPPPFPETYTSCYKTYTLRNSTLDYIIMKNKCIVIRVKCFYCAQLLRDLILKALDWREGVFVCFISYSAT